MSTCFVRVGSFALVSVVALAACGGDSDDDGVAPTIANLELSPSTVPSAKATALSGTVDMNDPDGDASLLAAEVTPPTGPKQALPRSQLQGASGVRGGKLQVALFLQPPSPGAYLIELFVVDAKGHESNRVSITVTAN
jgi:hypothetical protein